MSDASRNPRTSYPLVAPTSSTDDDVVSTGSTDDDVVSAGSTDGWVDDGLGAQPPMADIGRSGCRKDGSLMP